MHPVRPRGASPSLPFRPPSFLADRRRQINGGSNVGTLFALTIRPGFTDKKCTLNFNDPSYLSGTHSIQLFTVGGPVTGRETWNSRPYRDQHVGTFTAVSPGSAVWTASYKRTFNCPAGGTRLYYEAVPTGDNDAVYWSLPNGLVVTVG